MLRPVFHQMINPKTITNYADWLKVLEDIKPPYQQALKDWADKKWKIAGNQDIDPTVYITAVASYNELIHCADTLKWYEKNGYVSNDNVVFKAALDRMNQLVQDLSGFVAWVAII